MSPLAVTVLVVIALAGLEVVRMVPQLTRLWRTKDVAGLSPSAMTIRTVSGLGWLIYAFQVGEAPSIGSSVVFQIIIAATAVAMIRAGGLPRKAWLSAVPMLIAIAAACTTAHLTGSGPLALALVMNGSILVWGIPQLVVAMRSQRLSGFSPVALSVSLLDGVVWGVYGLVIWNFGYLLYCGVIVLLNAPLVIRYFQVEKRHIALPIDKAEPVAA